jgi:uncharacterized protein YfaS (alpha-2-macroglobulin family)
VRNVLSLVVGGVFVLLLLTLGISREVPIGSIAGTVTMAENGKPIPGVLVVISPASTDPDYDFVAHNYHVKTGPDGHFSLNRIPSGDYQLEVAARDHTLKARSIVVPEGSVASLNLELAPQKANLQLYASQKVLAPQSADTVEVHGFCDTSEFALQIHRLRLDQIAAKQGIQDALEPVALKHDNLPQAEISAISDPVWKGTLTVQKRDVEGSFEQSAQIPKLNEGLYLVTVSGGNLSAGVFLNVTKLALITKTVANKTLCYATDIDSGRPLPDVSLALNLGNASKIVQLGKTDKDGLATIQLQPSQNATLIVARSGNSVAVSQASLGNRDAASHEVDPNVRIFTYADRPVYRPGDTVHFKAIVRRLAGDDLVLPGQGQATVKFSDPQNNVLQSVTLPVSAHGTLNGSFTTNSETVPGVYPVEVEAFRGQDTYYANLAAYRKPDYSVKVTPTARRLILGDTGSAVVECQYFFGGPVVGAKVTATIYRNPAWQDENEDDTGTSDDEAFQGGQLVQTVDATTDGLGRATIQFSTGSPSAKDDEADSDFQYSIEASVQGSGDRSFEGSGSVLATRGAFGLSVDTDPSFTSVGQPANIVVKTFDLDSATKPIPGRKVSIKVDQETYMSHTVVYEPGTKASAATDQSGTAKISTRFTHAGTYRIRAIAIDGEGRSIAAATDLYVQGNDAPILSEEPKFELKLDHKKYATGDTAKLLLTTTNPGGVALLTVESDTIKTHRLVPLTSGSAIVQIPVDKSMSPNAFVAVSYVCHRHYSEANQKLVVNRSEKTLKLSITADRTKVLPGSDVTFHVHTANAGGRGIPANVSFGLVDESIYSIKKDSTDIRSSLYPQKDDLIQTNFSFPEIYLDGGDKAGGSVPIRRRFLDTAKWIPDLETDSGGNATVTVKVPDNLTSWRATGVAATDDTTVGIGTGQVVASKPLMVRLLTPRFMVATGAQDLSAAVTNASDQPQSVRFSTLVDGLVIHRSATDSLTLKPGETQTVSIPVTAPVAGEARIVATVTDAGASDGMEAKFPVLPHARLKEVNQSASVKGEQNFDFDLSSERDPRAGSLQVTVSPSIVGGLIQSLDQLVQFPYGCVEQTLSRFLPAVSVVDAIKGTSLSSPRLTERNRKIAADGYARLQKMQHADGGWGWWTYDDSDPFMTGWVLDGLLTAKNCGAPAPPGFNVAGALKWSEARLAKPLLSDRLDGKLYLALALAEYEKPEAGAALLSSVNADQCTAGQTALVALLADRIHNAAVRETALNTLSQNLAEDALKFGARDRVFVDWWTEDEQTALLLRAFVTLRPTDPAVTTFANRLEKLKRWDGWISTRATTMATLAMCDYIRSHPRALGSGTISIELNGAPLRLVAVDATHPESPRLKFAIPISDLRVGQNRLTVSSDQLEPYVAIDLKQYLVEPVLKAEAGGNGLTVTRSYFKMEPTRLADGTLKLLPSRQPLTHFNAGDIVRCRVIVHCDRRVDFLQVEDPLPSNCEVTDREDPMDGSAWSFWWSDLSIFDDRMAMFARDMPRGDNILTYTLRAEGSGSCAVLPTHVLNMYAPQFTASGAESKVVVSR